MLTFPPFTPPYDDWILLVFSIEVVLIYDCRCGGIGRFYPNIEDKAIF
jgi:hypothetical protein